MFDFCTRRLGMSEGEAFRRINAARIVRRFPDLLLRIERGEIHLSALVLLREHLTDSNWKELVDQACGKSKREVEEIVARHFPRPDVPSTIRKLPAPQRTATPHPTTLETALVSSPETKIETAPREVGRFAPAQVREAPLLPLSPERYKLQLTASSALREKLERATELMRHRNPSGDMAAVIERALDLLIANLEKEKLGKTTRPAKRQRPARHDRIPRATRRAVFARDGEQCTFRDASDHRCMSRSFLEIDHVHPRALGGSSEIGNLRVLCRHHNQLLAERSFGRTHIERRIHARQHPDADHTSTFAGASEDNGSEKKEYSKASRARAPSST